jgi:hypothetical protein
MKFNKWTVALAAIGVVSLASAARADEQPTTMNAVHTALSSTTLSGYVDTAAQWNLGTDQIPGGAAHTPFYSFAKNDGFSLNAIDIALDKPEDESPWAAGYHVELMAGPDAQPAATAGNVAVRQAYVTLRTPVGNGLDWKVGVWDTIIGYESTSDPVNPNYTRSYGYTIEPTTHTGILATYKISDMFTIQAGIADDSNVGNGTVGVNPLRSESQKAYMGDFQFTAPDSAGFAKGATFTFGWIDAAGDVRSPGSTSWYAGMTLPTPVTALKVGAAFDWLDLHNANNNGVAGSGGASDDSTWVAGLYTTIQATDKLSFNLRGEYVSDNGAGVNGVGVGITDKLEELTATVQYNLWANVISRVEVRWDHSEHFHPYGANYPTGSAPWRDNDFLMALNLIYQF